MSYGAEPEGFGLTCPGCGAVLSEWSERCPHCGRELREFGDLTYRPRRPAWLGRLALVIVLGMVVLMVVAAVMIWRLG